MAANAAVGPAARRSASSRAESASSSSSTTALTSPSSSAPSAETRSFRYISADVFAVPTSRLRLQVMPESPASPMPVNAVANTAERAAQRRSQARAMPSPAPATAPLMAATTGLGISVERPHDRVVVAPDEVAQVGRLGAGVGRLQLAQVLADAERPAAAGEQHRPYRRVLGRPRSAPRAALLWLPARARPWRPGG